MTKVQSYLASLPEEKRALFAPVYGDVDRFYTVVYLIAKNEHLTDLDKPAGREAAGWLRVGW